MGVSTRIVVEASDREKASAAAVAGFARIAQIEQVASDYRPSSEVMRLCRGELPVVDGWVAVSRDLAELLRRSERVSAASGGAFDVTVGRASLLWREARRSGVLPSEAERAAAVSATDWRLVRVDPLEDRVRALAGGSGGAAVRIDFGGIAKGYAAQEAVKVLTREGVGRCLVSIAGDVYAGGAPTGERGWVVSMAGDSGSPEVGRVVLRNGGVSTSGDREQVVVIDGVRYSHIVDPRTGLGGRGGVVVTVMGKDGAVVDAAATAAVLLWPDGDAIERLRGLGVEVMVHGEGTSSNGKVLRSNEGVEEGIRDQPPAAVEKSKREQRAER